MLFIASHIAMRKLKRKSDGLLRAAKLILFSDIRYIIYDKQKANCQKGQFAMCSLNTFIN